MFSREVAKTRKSSRNLKISFLTLTRDFVEISSKACTSTESSLFYRNKIKWFWFLELNKRRTVQEVEKGREWKGKLLRPEAFTCRSIVLYFIELLPFFLSPIFQLWIALRSTYLKAPPNVGNSFSSFDWLSLHFNRFEHVTTVGALKLPLILKGKVFGTVFAALYLFYGWMSELEPRKDRK